MRRVMCFTVLVGVMAFCMPSVVRAQDPGPDVRLSIRPQEDVLSVLVTPDSASDISISERVATEIRSSVAERGSVLEPVRIEFSNIPIAKPTLTQTSVFLNGPDSVERLSEQMAERARAGSAAIGGTVPADMRAARETLLRANIDNLDAAQLQEARESGMARIMADRQTFRQSRAGLAAPAAARSVSTDAPGLARKTPLLPLPSAPSSPGPPPREQDILRLTEAIENADNPDEIDRLHLRLAAAYVGAGQWGEAESIYEDLVQSARLASLRQTAAGNLRILTGEEPSGAAERPEAVNPGIVTGTSVGRVEQ